MHFHKIQEISDSTTLPQMLVELGKGLDRVANVDAIVSDLRHAFCFPVCPSLPLRQNLDSS